MESLFYVAFGVVVIFLLYQVFTKGGIKGAILGSKILRTTGEVTISKPMMTQVVRVHALENGHIGIELTSKAFLSVSMTGFTLSPDQSDRLISFLQNAK